MRFLALGLLTALFVSCLYPRFPAGIAGTVYAPIQFAAAQGYEHVNIRAFEAIVRFRSSSAARAQSSAWNLTDAITDSTVVLRLPSSATLRLQNAETAKQRTLEWISELRTREDVVFAEPNTILHLNAVPAPNDPRYATQWNYPMLHLPEAWNSFNAEQDIGAGVTVAVLDSGILWDKSDTTKQHPDFHCEVSPGLSKIAPGRDIAQNDDNPLDDALSGSGSALSAYHGTHVAGTIGACSNNALGVAGVAWRSRILPVRVFNGDSGSIADVAKGMYWAVGLPIPASIGGAQPPVNPNPAQVLNLSLGAQQAPSSVLQDAVNAVNAQGAVVVVASGNDGSDAALETPANLQGVIVVGALGPQHERAPYSNYGSIVSLVAPGGDFVLRGSAADGVLSIMGCGTPGGDVGDFNSPPGGRALPCASGLEAGYGSMQGTSMATPHVAGIIALMMSRQPALLNPPSSIERARNWTRVLAYLRDSSSLNGLIGCERGCGAGLLDASAAVNRALNLPPLGSVLVLRSPLGQIDLGTTQSSTSFTLANIGDAGASVSLSATGPGLSVSPSAATIAAGATQSFNINLNRSGLNGDYAGKITASVGARSLELRVYYRQGVNVIGNPSGYFVRIYKETATSRQRLNYPDLPLGANGSFDFGYLDPGTYDLTAYHLSSTNPDGTVVADQLGESLSVSVSTERVNQTITLEPVQQTICSREGTLVSGPSKCPGQ